MNKYFGYLLSSAKNINEFMMQFWMEMIVSVFVLSKLCQFKTLTVESVVF